jgi:hypothetical protein
MFELLIDLHERNLNRWKKFPGSEISERDQPHPPRAIVLVPDLEMQ